ncbi:MAG: serine/threonine protein kinase [Lysobacter sp.]|nr:serine/threonine protein kinase [Lysobacter sp.]
MGAEDTAGILRSLQRHLALPGPLRAPHLWWLHWRKPAMADRLALLLQAEHRNDNSLLDRTPQSSLPRTSAPSHADVDLTPGDRLGPWRIDSLLGQGGMGCVHLAHRDDGAYRQSVAIKRIRIEAASRPPTDAFLREREILAKLSHPGISRLIDGGLDAGDRPWLAMELIDGAPIDRWCDHRRRTIVERVTLLLQVCDAVQYAHKHGVVHGDIKPANLLVDDDGLVRLLDFGVASLLSDGESDGTVRLGMTAAYAAPERIAQESPGFASDIYSLGAVLCELVFDTPPTASPIPLLCNLLSEDAFDTEALIDGATPAALRARGLSSRRSLARLLHSDLDAILRKCLQPVPEQRYATAADLAADLKGWLQARPVSAVAGRPGYRLGKLVRRHRFAAAAIACLSLGLTATLGGQWLKHRQNERDMAALSLVFEESLGSAAMSGLGEAGLNPRVLLGRTESKLRESRNDHNDNTMAYGLLTLSRNYITIGDYAHALELGEEARTLGEDNPTIQARADATRAIALNQQARHVEAETICRRALQENTGFLDRAFEDRPTRIGLTTELARARWHQGRHDEALTLLDEALEASRYLRGDASRMLPELLTLRAQWHTDIYDTTTAEAELDQAIRLGGERYPQVANNARLALVRTLLRMNRQPEARSLAIETLAAFEKTYGMRHPETGRALLACSEATLHAVAIDEAQVRQALAYSKRAMDVLGQSLGRQHPYYTESLKYTASARALLSDGRPEDIIAQARQSVALLASSRGATLEQTISAKITLANILSEFSIDLDDRTLLDESLALYEDIARETERRKLPIPHVLSIYARALNDAGRTADAKRIIQRANTEIRRYLGADHPYLVFNELLSAKMAIDAGADGEAIAPLEDILRITAAKPGDSKTIKLARFGAMYMRAGIHQRQNASADARGLLTEAIAFGTTIHGDPEHPKIRELREQLARLPPPTRMPDGASPGATAALRQPR